MSKLVIITYLYTLFCLIYTNDLYQNSDERLLIPKNISNSRSAETSSQYDTLIMASNHNPNTERLENFLADQEIDFRIITPTTLSKKKEQKEVIKFYKKHKELEMKLYRNGYFINIIMLSRDQRRQHPGVINFIKSNYSKVTLSGLPYLNYHISETTLDIKKIILPLLLTISFILIFLITQKLSLSFVIFMYPLSAIGTSLLTLKLFFNEANLLSNLAPMVNFVVVFCLVIHLYYSYKEFKDHREVVKHKFIPISFMLVTTLLGIASLSLSKVPAIRIFSQTSATSLFITAFFTLMTFKLFQNAIYSTDKKETKPILLPKKLRPSIVYTALIVPFLLFVLTYNKLQIQVDALFFFPKESNVSKSIRLVEKSVIGTPILEIIIDNFLIGEDYSNIQKISELESEIRDTLEEPPIIISQTQAVKDANYIYTGERVLPSNKFAALTLLSKIPIVNDNKEQYSVVLLSKAMSTLKYQQTLKRIVTILNNRNISFRFTGSYYDLIQSQSEIISTLLKSFILSLLLITIFVSYFVRSITSIVTFLIINLIPPIVTLSIFALANISLNLATVMTFSVSFGLIVDSTIHVMYANKTNLSEIQKQISVFQPILISSLILFLSFMTFLIHSFSPIWQFGLSLSLTIFFGFIYDFYILPNIENVTNLSDTD